MTAVVLAFKKIEIKDKTKYCNFYSNSRAEIIINKSDIDDVFQLIYTTIITNMQKSLGMVQAGLLIQSMIKPLVFQSVIL